MPTDILRAQDCTFTVEACGRPDLAARATPLDRRSIFLVVVLLANDIGVPEIRGVHASVTCRCQWCSAAARWVSVEIRYASPRRCRNQLTPSVSSS